MAEICIYGAGSIGCYVGGRLAATGARVTFVGRQRLANEIRQHGLHITDYLGADFRIAPSTVNFSTDPAAARDADLVLVAVKSSGTADAGRELEGVLKSGAIIVSFQNGLHNTEALHAQMPNRFVLAGMVEFNVVHRGDGAFHQGSEGGLEVQDHPGLVPFLPAFEKAGLPLKRHQDMRGVQWAKLQLNLNNAINALSGVPLKEELSQRGFRQCLALAQRELLDSLAVARIAPTQITAVPPQWLPRSLDVPDFVFHRLAAKMLAIDPFARSSMWDDLEAGRTTEVDVLNGEVVRLAQSQGRAAPVNAKLVELVHAAERGGRHDWKADELLAQLRGVTRTSA